MMNRLRNVVLLSLGLAAAAAGGCANTYGVDVQNKTGEQLLVEFLTVSSDGSTTPYSTALLGPKGSFTNKVTYDEQGFGKRVRFSLPGRPAADAGSVVELKLADDKIRTYNLILKNGRLVADELPMGRAPISEPAM